MYQHLWDRLRAENPAHSENYAKRWREFAAEGKDLDGEARFISALVAPGSRVLDAGCGQGRVGGYLSDRGYAVTGVDLDDYLIREARNLFPLASWFIGDLAELDLAGLTVASAADRGAGFDVIVSAGNVLTFLDPAARLPALRNIAASLAPGGRFVSGFGVERGYGLEAYASDLAEAGFAVEQRFGTWNLHPFTAESDFLVCVSGLA